MPCLLISDKHLQANRRYTRNPDIDWQILRFQKRTWVIGSVGKNCSVPVTGLVTVFCPSTTTADAPTAVQTAEAKLVVDCKANPWVFVRQDKTTFAPAGLIVSFGLSE